MLLVYPCVVCFCHVFAGSKWCACSLVGARTSVLENLYISAVGNVAALASIAAKQRRERGYFVRVA